MRFFQWLDIFGRFGAATRVIFWGYLAYRLIPGGSFPAALSYLEVT